MSERAAMPLGTAVVVGLLGGVVASILLLDGGPAAGLALAGAAICAVSGVSSTARCEGDRGEPGLVGVVRAVLAVGLFLSLYAGLLRALRDGEGLSAAVLLAMAAGLALLLSRADAHAGPRERARRRAERRDRGRGAATA